MCWLLSACIEKVEASRTHSGSLALAVLSEEISKNTSSLVRAHIHLHNGSRRIVGFAEAHSVRNVHS